jgi:hypothetical protein
MATTTKRRLPLMAGSDPAATIDNTYDAAMGLLDDGTLFIEDVFANRPTPAQAGIDVFFRPTDEEGTLYLSDGSNWIQIAPSIGVIPIGASMDWWKDADPGDTRFARMDGRALSKATYPRLYGLLGDRYATHRGAAAPSAGLFRIPNLAGLVTVAAGGAATNPATSTRALDDVGGSEPSNMPSHNHTGATASMNRSNPHAHSIFDPGHGHSISGGVPIYNTIYSGAGAPAVQGGNSFAFPRQALGADRAGTGIGVYATDINHEHAIAAQGGGADNMPPFIVVPKVMRIA